jgi:hypothetical protein
VKRNENGLRRKSRTATPIDCRCPARALVASLR